MLFKRLTLFNIGLYAGENTFTFNGNKPVVLIGGLNGHGKTTFLESILLALYGSDSFAFTDNKVSSYTQYLKNFINTKDGSMSSYVELEFLLEDSVADVYKIKRSWTDGNKISDSVEVYINDEYDEFITQNWHMFIENILPSALSKFFIFDGEKIIVWANENNNRQIKDSILALLGLNVLDNLKNDLNRILSTRKIANEDGLLEDSEIVELKNRLSIQKNLYNKKKSALEDLENNKLQYIQEENNIRVEFNTSGGDILNDLDNIKDKIKDIKAVLDKLKEKNIDIASRELPLLMLEPLFNDVLEKSLEEIENESLKQSIDKIKKLSEEFVGNSKNNSKENILDFIGYLEDQTSQDKEVIYNLSKNGYYKMEDLKNVKFKNTIEEYKENKNQISKKLKELKKYESALNIDIDSNKVEELSQKLKEIQAKIKICDTDIFIASEELKDIKNKLNAVESEYEEKISVYLSKIELNNDNNRLNKYAHMALNILQKFKDKIVENKINDLSIKMTECFKNLIGKKNLISKIEIDSKSLDFIYYNGKNEKIAQNRLSAGEKQIVVIALLWSLSLSTDKKLPVIIDTPLSRLDTVNRYSLVKSYFPNASNQTIILSTDSEIDKKYYDVIKESVDNEYTLNYKDDETCTEINVGYFKDTLL